MKGFLKVFFTVSLGMMSILLFILGIRVLKDSWADQEHEADMERQSTELVSGSNSQEEGIPVPTVVIEQDRGIGLLFGGDVCLQDFIVEYYQKEGAEGVVAPELKRIMKEADIMMVNQEFSFSSRGTAMEDKEYTFRVPLENVTLFTELGIDIVTLANNHTLDFGREALKDSFQALEEAGILYAGAGENYDRARKMEVIQVKGKKIGFLAASRVIPVGDWNAGKSRSGLFTTYDPEPLLAEIKAGKEKCDMLVVYVHWGEERNQYPEEYQKTMARQYIDAGADAVIGSHPHVLQGIEYYKDKPICYSLGNYIFSARTGDTALLRIRVGENGELGLGLIPVDASAFPVKQMETEKWPEFFRYIEKISFGITIDEGGNVVYNKE